MLTCDKTVCTPANFRIACNNNLSSSYDPSTIACLWRSSHFNWMSHDCAEFLVDTLKIQVNIDLRSMQEVQDNGPPHQVIDRGMLWHHIPLKQQSTHLRQTKIPNAHDYFLYYSALLEENKTVLKQIIQYIAYSEQKRFVINCLAGKDRTGIVIMLLMSALGIANPDIIEDYQISKRYLLPKLDQFKLHWEKKQLTKQQYALRFNCDPSSMSNLIDQIINTYHSMDNYFSELNIDSTCINALRSKFYAYGETP